MKPILRRGKGLQLTSHPVRVRGLKLWVLGRVTGAILSHPVRVRGLKPFRVPIDTTWRRRTPCGCVG